MKSREKIIIGIDPGFGITGYGIIKTDGNAYKILEYGCIKTSAKMNFIDRLEVIHCELNQLIKKYKPTKAAVEQLFFAKNVKTAMQVGEARGVILLTIIQNRIPLIEFTPLQVKQALTGYGQASKEQVQKMVKLILGMKNAPRQDDAADALGIAITCANTKYNL